MNMIKHEFLGQFYVNFVLFRSVILFQSNEAVHYNDSRQIDKASEQ